MRKANREIKDEQLMRQTLETADTCRLALNTGGAPYIVPLSYGYTLEDNRLTLYFHCADEGRKLELMAADNRAGFELDCGQKLVTGPKACHYSTQFMSIVAVSYTHLTRYQGQHCPRKNARETGNYLCFRV